jgi:transposase, IS30 family
VNALSYKHFTLEERKSLEVYLKDKLSFRKIAALMGRSPSTISREVNRNKAKYKPRAPRNDWFYHHWHAQSLYIQRRRNREWYALEPGTPQWNYIVEKLGEKWSPEAISGRWIKDNPNEKPICFATIYRYIYKGEFPKITAKDNLRRHGKRHQTRNACYNTIQPDRTIPEWPEEIVNRMRIGDWEGDTVYGGIGKGLLVTLVDRKTRYLRLGLLKKRNAEETRKVIEHLLEGMPVNSISLDNGSEFSEFHKLENNLNTLVYFAEPHKPWQRGTNENTNDRVRFFFPKGFDFRTITGEDVQAVEDMINNMPRKCLGWKTPAEVFQEESVALG